MTNVSNVISFEQFVQDFDSLFQHRVFRLETLDKYDAPNEHEPYARFLAGEPADWAWREPWKRLVRDVRASGRIMQRVHVVSEPISDYIRFELLRVYPANVEAGEDVQIIDRAKATGRGLTLADFWLFDDDLTAMLGYDDQGGVASVNLISEERAREVAMPFLLPLLRQTRDDALNWAIPLARYVERHSITEGRTQAA